MLLEFITSALALCSLAFAVPQITKRDAGFVQGNPISAEGKGAVLLGGTNHQIDLQNPANLGSESTDSGVVPHLKWRFSDSKTRLLEGGWVREQVVQDLPQSHDISAAQQHLVKGAIRELHWHRVAEWGIVYNGSILISGVNEDGNYTQETLGFGDVWYFPKGAAHTIQGLADENEYLLVFDDGDFDRVGTTFNVDDWLSKVPKTILAKNFGVNESVFASLPTANPYILNGTVSTTKVTGGTALYGNSSWVYRTFQHPPENISGNGGSFYKIDSTNFPIAKTIAATVVTLKPKGLRELHWHPGAEEWLYFHKGHAHATVFIGNSNARTFDFQAGDVGVFPDNAGHYIENTSATEDLV